MPTDTVPNPGSEAACALGCKCPVLDNARGRGIPWPRDDGLDPNEHPSFYTNEDCPLHGTPTVTLFDYQQWRHASAVTPAMLDSCLDRIAELEAAANLHFADTGKKAPS
jgi:hypothetical protein